MKSKRCVKCNAVFSPRTARQKFCKKCSPYIGGYNKDKRRAAHVKQSKTRAGIAARIETLGRLNDEHKDLLGKRDAAGLVALAEKYMRLKHPCTIIARAIRMQAAQLEG